jgi:hypothetical protein
LKFPTRHRLPARERLGGKECYGWTTG